MVARRLLGILPCVLLLAGCTHESDSALVSPSPFTPAPPPIHTASHGPVSIAVAARVDQVGQKILAANKSAGLTVVFQTIGAPQPEIFHKGTNQLVITSGLVERCQTDGQLAAVLCTELARMVTERESQANPASRHPDPQAPLDLRIGNSGGAASGPADQTQLAELAKFEPTRRRTPATALPLPDPQQLARTYLTNANFSQADMDQARTLLASASGNDTFERQMNGTGDSRQWTNPQ